MGAWTYIWIGLMFLLIGGLVGGSGVWLGGTAGVVLAVVGGMLGVFGVLLTSIGIVAEGVRLGNEP